MCSERHRNLNESVFEMMELHSEELEVDHRRDVMNGIITF